MFDQTYCASENCTNACGRKLPEHVAKAAEENNRYLSFAYFCGQPESENVG